MLLSLNSRLVGDVSVIECVGRVVLGDEVKALEGALEAGERESARIVLHAGKQVIIANGRTPRVLERIVAGEQVGTLFAAAREPVGEKVAR